ncbi:MAG: hypothetical protein Q7S40_32850, partial [Opitutaceae bacterium]|nr:hypothetical protein [Opitutaceae bacterium]
MNRIRALVSVSLFFASSLAGFAAASASTDWPGWRGPPRDGQAAAGQTVPLKWSETQNVVWRTGVRGKGHS